MPVNCCVPLCTANIKKCRGLSFHKFPSDSNLRKQWITKIRRDVGKHFKITVHTKVCSRHFTEDCFVNSCGKFRFKNKLLKKDAIPMLFDWNSYKLPESRKDPPKKYEPSESVIVYETLDCVVTLEEDTDENILQENILEVHNQPPDPNVDEMDEVKQLKILLEQQLSENQILRKRIFCAEKFSCDDKQINFYTGFHAYKIFKIFFDHIKESASSMNYYPYTRDKNDIKIDAENPSLLNDYFMYLVKLKRGYSNLELSERFDLEPSTVSRKIISWANFLFVTLGRMTFWLSRNEINSYMPDIFREYCPSVRVIVDFTEIKIQNPISPLRRSQFFSTHKNYSTVKGLIGITPHGTVSFISKLYSGSCSDVYIFRNCGITELLEPGDSVLAVKGFAITKDLDEIGCSLVIPTYKNILGQFGMKEIKHNKTVSALRIHVEKAIRRFKTYELFAKTIPLNMVGTLQQHWTNAVLLSNFKPPLVKNLVPYKMH